MTDTPAPPGAQLLPVDFWPDPASRSEELTPTYIQRYVGPRLNPVATAHPFTEITCCLSGTGQMVFGSSIPLRPHRTLLIGPGVLHREHATGDLETLWIGLRGRLADHLPKQTILTIDQPALTPIVERLWDVAQSWSTGRGGPECDALARLVFARATQAEPPGARRDTVSQVLALMHERLHRPTTIGQLASAVGCSEGHLHRAFKAGVGETPIQCLTRLRMERAVQLLGQTRLSIKQIARRVGYRDPLYFSRVFHAHYGRSPRAARAADE